MDDYGGYKALFSRTTAPCIELGCWAHARRKFFDLHQANDSPMAYEALQSIGALYAIEAEGKLLTPEARQQLRAEKSLSLLDTFHHWLLQTRAQTVNGGASAKALDYTLRRWPSLVRYATTGHLPIDNNPVENAIRPIAIGKKNWLFAGSKRAGQRAAVLQTLPGTAQLNGLDPAAHGSPKPLSNSPPGLIIVSTNSSPLLQSSFNYFARKLKRWGRWTVTLIIAKRTLDSLGSGIGRILVLFTSAERSSYFFMWICERINRKYSRGVSIHYITVGCPYDPGHLYSAYNGNADEAG